MDSNYQDFLRKYPEVEDRIDALISGILTPDTKAISLWSLGHGRFYKLSEIHERVKEFSGGRFPLAMKSTWEYYQGSHKREGSLYTIAAVIKQHLKINHSSEGPIVEVLYAKSSLGEEIGDALVARALKLVTRLNSKYRSMKRIFGSPTKPKGAEMRRGYGVYRIVKQLVENPREYRFNQLENIIEGSGPVLSSTLTLLGDAGIIIYDSPMREKSGKRSGWVQHTLADYSLIEKSPENVYTEVKTATSSKFSRESDVKKILDYIRDHPKNSFEANNLSKKLSISRGNTSYILSVLRKLRYLHSDFRGREVSSRIIPTRNVSVLWEILLEPVEAIAQRLEPSDYQGFYEALSEYDSNPGMRTQEIQCWLNIYDKERNERGIKGSEELNEMLFLLPAQKIFKASEILSWLIEKRKSWISRTTVFYHLSHLVDLGYFERVEKGRYKRV